MTKAYERFKNDTANHSMQVLHDNELYRHLRFTNNGSSAYWFDITTWPNYLCISGDMGCFTFNRIDDMFRFFRCDNLESVNPYYWSEKVEAGARCGRDKICKEWSQEKFYDNVREYFKSWSEDRSLSDKKEVWQEIKDSVLSCDDEWESVTAINNFYNKKFEFNDFWEHDNTEWTFHYLWCCYAIVWAISKYDDFKSSIDNKTVNDE